MNKILLSVIITTVVVGAGAFYGGMKYQQSKIPQRQQMLGANVGNFRDRAGANIVNGKIIAKDDKSITVETNDSGSKIVFYSGVTEIGKTATVTPDDMEIGKTVSVNGSANSDGSITARLIQLRP